MAVPHRVYDLRLADGRSVGDAVLAPLVEAQVPLYVVDVGARNGNYLLPRQYTEHATLVGFEPNPEEFAKLDAGKTDAAQAFAAMGLDLPAFRAERYHPYALWDANERRPFYITRGAGACTLMGPTTDVARNIFYRYPGNDDPRRRRSLHDLHTEVKEVIELDCRRLDELMGDDEVVDLLKVDVEGADIRVLQGAEKLFRERRVLFIRSEFQMVPYYEEHPLLADQHRYLADHGFRLLDLELNHPRYRRGGTDLPDRSDRGLLLAGDALFALDPDRLDLTPLERQRIAALALAFELNGFGLSLVEEAGLLAPPQQRALAQALAQPPARSLQGRLLDAWVEFPHRVKGLAQRLRGR